MKLSPGESVGTAEQVFVSFLELSELEFFEVKNGNLTTYEVEDEDQSITVACFYSNGDLKELRGKRYV